MNSRLDLETLFERVAGRIMTTVERAELRRLVASMPDALAGSPSYMHNIVLTYYQLQQLRGTVADAADNIVDDVERQTDKAVQKLVDKSLTRILASSPSQSAALYRAFVAATIFGVFCVVVAVFGIHAALSRGLWLPPWLSQEAAAKVEWANEVESRLGRGRVDWVMREGQPDTKLVSILTSLDVRGTDQDPVRQLAQMKACRFNGGVAYARRRKTYCRFEVGTQR